MKGWISQALLGITGMLAYGYFAVVGTAFAYAMGHDTGLLPAVLGLGFALGVSAHHVARGRGAWVVAVQMGAVALAWTAGKFAARLLGWLT